MLKTRIIPCLLLRGAGLVKTVRFKDPTYVGDPINAVRIFNDKEVDELVFLDITATREGREPNYDVVQTIASEAFMPLGYGGGVTNLEQMQRLYAIGVEKVIINTSAVAKPSLIEDGARMAGSQSVVVSIDVKRERSGYAVRTNGGTTDAKIDPVTFARQCEERGAGEIFLTAMDRDGTQEGYDLELIEQVSSAVSVPVVACGGAGGLEDFPTAVASGASAVAAGSLFVFHGKFRAVLITYPNHGSLEALMKEAEGQS